MRKHKLLSSILAASFLMGTVSSLTACSPEQIAAATAVAKSFLADFEAQNKASVDLETVDEEGNVVDVSANEIDSVTVGGKQVKYSTDEEGNVVLEDFAMADEGQAEAEVHLKGYDQPLVIVISVNGQTRENIKLHARAAVSKAQGKKILLQEKAESFDRDAAKQMAQARKESIQMMIPEEIKAQLANKKIMGIWLEGERLPHTNFWVDPAGHLLINIALFRRAFLGDAPELRQAKDKVKRQTVSVRNSKNFEKKKAAVRRTVLRKKTTFVRKVKTTQKVRKSVAVKKFTTAQVKAPLPKLTPELLARIEQVKANLTPEQRAKLDAQKNKAKVRLEKGKVKLKNGKELTKKQLASVRGGAAAQLAAQEHIFKTRTLYVLAKDMSNGQMCMFKFQFKGDMIRALADQIEHRLAEAHKKAEEARRRLQAKKEELKNKGQDAVQAFEAELQQVSAAVDVEAQLTEEGDLTIEVSVDDINADTEDVVETVQSVEEAEEVVEAEEIEEEIEDEVEADLAVELEESGEALAEDEEIAIDLNESDVDQVESDNADITNEVADELLVEEDLNLETEISEGETEATESEEFFEEVFVEEEFVEETAA